MNAIALRTWMLAITIFPMSACTARAPSNPSAPPSLDDAPSAPLSKVTSFDGSATPVLAAQDAAAAVVSADSGLLVEASTVMPDADPTSDAAGPSAKAVPEGGSSPDAQPAPIAVMGTVTDPYSVPLPQASVSVLDGAGAVHNTMTDATGAFVMPNVVIPYLATVGPPAPGNAGMWSYVDVTTATPHFMGTLAPSTAPSPGVSFNVTITMPSCGMATCLLTLNAVASNGRTESISRDGAPGSTILFTVGLPGAVGESLGVTFDILASDGLCSSYWYSQMTASEVAGATLWNTSMNLGPVELPAIPIVGQTTIRPTPAASGAASCVTSTQLSLAFADGSGQTMLAQVASDDLSCNVPDILGATSSVIAGPECDDSTETSGGGSSFVANGLALTTPSVDAAYPVIAAFVAPSANGQDIPVTSTITWQPVAPGLSWFSIAPAGAGPGLTVVTSGSSVSLEALAKTGVALAPGLHTISVEIFGPSADLDAALTSGVGLSFPADQAQTGWMTGSFLNATLTP